MPVIGSLRFCDVACRHVDCANIAFSNRSGLNTNPLLDSVGVRPLIDQYVYCLTTTFSFPLPEGDKLAPSTQKDFFFESSERGGVSITQYRQC